MKTFLRNYKASVPAAFVLVIALAWVAFGYFGVHKLWVDDKVNEAAPVFDSAPLTASAESPSTVLPTTTVDPAPAATVPVATTAGPAALAPAPATTVPAPVTTVPPPATTVAPPVATVAPQPVVEASGSFVSRNHPTSGNAIVLGQGTGQRFLRLEQFATENGPDLKVYLVNSSAGGVTDYVSLGALKGNIGDQNYELPVGLDLQVYDTVLIYCERFASAFGEALLT